MPNFSTSPDRLSPADLGASEASSIYATIITVTIIATAGVVLRFLSRKKSNTALSWDDYTIAIALVFLYGLNIGTILLVALWGLGKHVEAVPPSDIQPFQKGGFVNFLLYFTTSATIKASLLFLYHRLFGISKRFRLMTNISAVIVFGWYISFVFAGVFQCVPVQAFWDRSIRNARCHSVITFSIISGVTNLLTDVMVLLLPMPMVWTLNTNRTQKVTLTGIFMLGFFVCAVSVARLVTLAKADYSDPTWRLKDVFIWTSVESSIGILSACLPTMRPLFGRFLHLPTRTAVTPRTHGSDPRKKMANTSGIINPTAPTKDGFARIDEDTAGDYVSESSDAEINPWRDRDNSAKDIFQMRRTGRA